MLLGILSQPSNFKELFSLQCFTTCCVRCVSFFSKRRRDPALLSPRERCSAQVITRDKSTKRTVEQPCHRHCSAGRRWPDSDLCAMDDIAARESIDSMHKNAESTPTSIDHDNQAHVVESLQLHSALAAGQQEQHRHCASLRGRATPPCVWEVTSGDP